MRGLRQWGGVLAVALICAAIFLGSAHELTRPVSGEAMRRPLVTVDAGHGGFDGGAVAKDGTEEKDINLAIALPLGDILRLCGMQVQMTRTADAALCEDEGLSIREKKVRDMGERLSLYEQADCNVAIHQNMFGAAKYHGAQVFYSQNHPLSKVLASAVREAVYTRLQPDNTRELKSGGRDIYLLYKASRPTVLIECGFLSNDAELRGLQSVEYQKKMAFCVACGVLNFEGERE